MRRRWWRRAAPVGLVLVLAWRLVGHAPAVATAVLPDAEPAGAVGDSLIVEPDEGMGVIDTLLSSPRRTLDLTMYELADPTAEALLAADAERGVRVRVLLDSGLERARNQPAYDFLRARGVAVIWSSRRFFATHEKTFVIDRDVAVVMSLNLTDRYYATSRDLAVVDRDRRDVAAIESVFDADLLGASTGTPAADDLVWSPGQSAADLVTLIDGAKHSIALESEELSSQRVISALVSAARRGVAVSIAMTYDASWAAGFDAITAVGGDVGVLHGETPVYIHAKLLVVDSGTPQARAFVGSENLSDASLLHDRELGLVLVAPRLVAQIAAIVADDVSAGQPWR